MHLQSLIVYLCFTLSLLIILLLSMTANADDKPAALKASIAQCYPGQGYVVEYQCCCHRWDGSRWHTCVISKSNNVDPSCDVQCRLALPCP
jgi:hypothetical protein